MATQVTLNSGSVDSAGSLALKTNGTTTAVTIGTDQSVNFSATGQRITGDFSNATVANRVAFQTSTANGNTGVYFLPNGTATTSNVIVSNASDPTNSALGILGAISSDIRISSAISGTGTYQPMTFYTGGSERVRIDTSGNVGIGTSSPEAPLHVAKSASGGDGGYLYLDNPAASTLNNKAGIRFATSSGGSFASTPTGEITNVITDASSAASALTFGTFNGSASGERMRIDSSGNLLVGTTSASGSTSTFKSTSAGQQSCAFWNNATSGTRYFVSFATEATSTDRGYITYNGTTVAIAQASDARLKENIVDAPSALPKIAALQIRSFDFKEDGRHVDYGVIAQELESVIPSAVFKGSETEDGEMDKPWSVGLEPIIPVLVKAIQEQQAIITALQADVAALKGTA